MAREIPSVDRLRRFADERLLYEAGMLYQVTIKLMNRHHEDDPVVEHALLETFGEANARRSLVESLAVTVHYAYLVVDRQRYEIHPPGHTEVSGSGDEPAVAPDDSFPDRLRSALETAAKSAGYGSLERMTESVRWSGRSTPSHSAHLQSLVDAGLLNEDAEISRMVNGTVPAPAWEILHAIQPGGGRGQRIPRPTTRPSRQAATRSVDSWSLSLRGDDGIRPIEVDPARTPGGELPVALIALTLEALSAEGWEVVHVSEDRSIDDEASISHVVRQRILLRR
ncbi:MAG TPA: hypothetical protein VJ204_12730 [Solirubrobacterales bacterium]|nr:hypothetical protein [Solirubrobacterales bacterium]